jgi:hypothetical protein
LKRRETKFVSNRVNEMAVRFDGGMAIAQGSEAWERKGGMPLDGLMVERSV